MGTAPNNAPKFNYIDIKFGTLLGVGRFGEVFIGEYKGSTVAIKKLGARPEANSLYSNIDNLIYIPSYELGTMRINPECKSLLKVFGYAERETPHCCYLIEELAPNKSLDVVMKVPTEDADPDKNAKGEKKSGLSLSIKAKIASGIIKGLSILHECHLVHRNLEPANIFIDEDFNAKIGDFEALVKENVEANTPPMVKDFRYHPPEIYNKGALATTKYDIWSLGLVLYYIFAEKYPYIGKTSEQIEMTEDRTFRFNESDLPVNMTLMLKRCSNINPEKRPSITDLMGWIDGFCLAIDFKDDSKDSQMKK